MFLPGEQCNTARCTGTQRWMSIFEGNALGNDAPGRCAKCCDEISAALNACQDGNPPVITQACREAFCNVACTLDGLPARVMGINLDFPAIRLVHAQDRLRASVRVEFAWPTVARVFACSGGAFES